MIVNGVFSTNSHGWLECHNDSSQVYFSPGAQGAGQVRYNTSSNHMEVWDGVAWRQVSTNVDIDLTSRARYTLEWAERKMQEEQHLRQLLEKNPALKDLHDKFEMMKLLVTEEKHD